MLTRDLSSARSKMDHFAQPIDEHNNAGVVVRVGWQPKNEVHTDRIPALWRNRQWLQRGTARRSRLDALTLLTGAHVLGHPLIQVRPPERLRHPEKGFLSAQMPARRCIMVLKKDPLFEVRVMWDTDSRVITLRELMPQESISPAESRELCSQRSGQLRRFLLEVLDQQATMFVLAVSLFDFRGQ